MIIVLIHSFIHSIKIHRTLSYADIGDAKKDGSLFDPQMALISQETNMYIVDFWRGVAKGIFPEKN